MLKLKKLVNQKLKEAIIRENQWNELWIQDCWTYKANIYELSFYWDGLHYK